MQVEALALQKWGNQEGLDQERQKRHTKRLERAKAKAGDMLCSTQRSQHPSCSRRQCTCLEHPWMGAGHAADWRCSGCGAAHAATSASLSGSPGASSPAPSPAPPQPAAQTPQSERRTGTAGEPAQATPPAASASGQALPGPGRRGAALPQFVLERIRNVRSGAAPVSVANTSLFGLPQHAQGAVSLLLQEHDSGLTPLMEKSRLVLSLPASSTAFPASTALVQWASAVQLVVVHGHGCRSAHTGQACGAHLGILEERELSSQPTCVSRLL